MLREQSNKGLLGIERWKEEWSLTENVFKADAICQGTLLHTGLCSHAWIMGAPILGWCYECQTLKYMLMIFYKKIIIKT